MRHTSVPQGVCFSFRMMNVMPRSLDIVRRRRAEPPLPKSRPRSRPRGSGWLVIGLILLGIVYVTFEGQRAGQLLTYETGSPTISPMTPTTTNPSLVIPSFETQGPTVTPTGKMTPTPAPSLTVTLQPPPTPTPTPTPPPDKKNISISVLNGSGRAGEGNKVRLELIEEGFTIRRLAVAPKTLASTTLYHQPSKAVEAAFVASYLPELKVELIENATEASPDDLVIVVGQEVIN